MGRIEVKPARNGHGARRQYRDRRLRPTVIGLESRALLSTLTVSNTDDSGSSSLRAAVTEANADGGGDTIVFSSVFDTPQTITLTSGQLSLTGAATTTIIGPGANLLTISGNKASGVFEIEGGSVAMSGLTVTGGQADRGAGLLNQGGTLSLTSVTVSGNVANDQGGGVDTQFSGTTTLTDCTISGNSVANHAGGGLANLYSGSATLTNCTISGNSAPTGGGLYNNTGTLSLTACTVSGNSAAEHGGGLSNSGGTTTLTASTVSGNSAAELGGGLSNSGGTTTLTASTVSNNSTPTGDGGGLANQNDTLALSNCTVTGNSAHGLAGGMSLSGGTIMVTGCAFMGNTASTGAGLAESGGTLSLINTTVTGNTATGQGGGLYVKQGAAILTNVTVSANSAATGGGLVTSGNAWTVTLTNTIVAGQQTGGDVTGNYSGSNNVVGGNPMLAQLFDYGGPTLTMPPLAGSPAIGKGTAGAGIPMTDQRGFPRGASIDIGAFQTQGAASMEVNVTTDGQGSGLGQLNLRQAINLANAQPGDSTVTFDPSVFSTTPQTITLTEGQIGLGSAGAPTIDGPGAGLLTINAHGASRIFLMKGTTATVSGLTITGGVAQFGGGIANYSGTLTLSGCVIARNQAYRRYYNAEGGGLFNTGSAAMTNCTITGNLGYFKGGGVRNHGGTLSMTNCSVSGNTAYEGGGIESAYPLNLTNCTIFDNTATSGSYGGQGGGILSYGALSMLNTIVSGNFGLDLVVHGSSSGSHNLVGGNAMLSAMGNFGGDTPTIGLLPGSPAIGGGTTGPGVPATDQRGFPRGASIDIGAFQTQSRLVVNVPTDAANAGFGQLTMRNALNVANGLNAAETITFDAGVFGASPVFSLTAGPLVLTDKSTVTITGPGTSPFTITGSGQSQVFDIEGGNSALVGLTITGGSADHGGGVYNNDGTLSLTGCTVSGNTAASAGGGLYNKSGTTTLVDSAVSDNSAPIGGGVSSTGGTLMLQNATISGNSAAEHGGGLSNSGGTTTLTNCTVSGNSANHLGGGLSVNPASTTTLTNTIVAGNSAPTSVDVSGALVSSSANNLIGDGAGMSGISNGSQGNQVGTVQAPIDPLLSPLGNYGGPTQTQALLPSSPSIAQGAAGTGVPTTDQRGMPRSGHVDVGAFQSQGFTLKPVADSTPQSAVIGKAFANSLAVTVVSVNPVEPVDGGFVTFVANPSSGSTGSLSAAKATIHGGTAGVSVTANYIPGSFTVSVSAVGAASPASFALTNTPSLLVNTTQDVIDSIDGMTSLREAIDYAMTLSTPSTITFSPAVFGSTPQTITLTLGSLPLANPATTTIVGPGAGLLTISGNQAVRVFDVSGSAALSGLTITQGQSDPDSGAGILNMHGTLTLTDCTITGNKSDLGGGAGVYALDGTTTLSGCVVTGNTGSVGAGVSIEGGTATITNSTISTNTGAIGGGLFVGQLGSVTITNSAIAGNTSIFGGGMCLEQGATAMLNGCTVSGNTAENTSGQGGGGLASLGGTVTMTNCTVSGNSAPDALGGGVYNTYTLSLFNCTVSGNSAASGGGLYTKSGSTATLKNTIVAGQKGGGDVSGPYTGVGNLINGIPGLAPLGDYGGPTPTMPLLPGSPAIAAGSKGFGVPTIDQRGLPRASSKPIDIGAFQSQGFNIAPVKGSTPQSADVTDAFAKPLAVTVTAKNAVEPVNGGVVTFTLNSGTGASATLSAGTAVIASGQAAVTATANSTPGNYTVSASAAGAGTASFALSNTEKASLRVTTLSDVVNPFDNLTSLREAVAYANAHPGPDTIVFDPTAFGKRPRTIRLIGGPLVLTDPATTTIIGPGARKLTIQGKGKSRIFDIEGGSLALSGVNIIDGNAGKGTAGAVRNDGGTLRLKHVTIRGNRALVGGGLFNNGRTMLSGVTIKANRALIGGNVFNTTRATLHWQRPRAVHQG